MEKRKVYISSTFKDLKEYRSTLINEFNKALSHQYELTRVMEHMYNTGDEMPLSEQCIEEVKKSDVYILVVGDTIGSFPPNSTRSYTQLEYDEAMKEEKDKIIVRLIKGNTNTDITEPKLKAVYELNKNFNQSLSSYKCCWT